MSFLRNLQSQIITTSALLILPSRRNKIFWAENDSEGSAYLAPVNIGGQTFLVILDTGSTDLWVISSKCTEDDCQRVPSYTETSSLSKTDTPFRLNYLVGSVTGEVGFETVMLGNYRISSQVFALANRTLGLYLSNTGHSGILGLAFDSQASIKLTTGQPLIKNLASHLPEESRYFAVGLSRFDSGSSFTIGELDPAYANFTEEFNWSDVYVNPGNDRVYDYWKVLLTGISVNGTFLEPLTESKVVDSPTPIAVLDTGTTLVLGPAIDVQYFWKTIGGSRQNKDGQWEVLCNRGVVVKITLGGNGTESEYVMHPSDVNWMDGGKEEDESGKWCIGGIQANDHVYSGDWLLGDIFLRSVYTVHKLETPTSPPQMGLLSTVDIDKALAEFWEERGYDNTTIGVALAERVEMKPSSKEGMVYGISVLVGFVAGFIGTVMILWWRLRRSQKASSARSRVSSRRY